MLLPYYSIGSDPDRIENQLNAEFTKHFDPVYIAKSGMELPMILPDSTARIMPGIWGIPNLKGSLKIWFKSEGIIKNKDTRILIRTSRCLIPANGFFIKYVEKFYFIYFPDEPVITLAGIYTFLKKSKDDREDYFFTILTQSNNLKMMGLSPVVPVIISTGSRRKYLNRKKPLMDITHLLQRKFNRTYHGIEVLPDIFSKKNPGKADFYLKHSKLNPIQKFPEKEILGSYYYF